MKRIEKSSLYVKEVIERGREFEYEDSSVFTDNRVREAMILHHHIDNHFR